MGEGALMLPSAAMLKNHIPANLVSTTEILKFIKVWATEWLAWRKKPTTYAKLLNGDWNFDVAMDMMHAFVLIRPVPEEHRQKAKLGEIGIKYICTCPQFTHYYNCKHCITWGLHTKEIVIPTRFNTKSVGKRKAPAGATLNKRSRCMEIDI